MSSWVQTANSNKELFRKKCLEGRKASGGPQCWGAHTWPLRTHPRGAVPLGVEVSCFENINKKWRVSQAQVSDSEGTWETYAHKTEKKLQPNISKWANEIKKMIKNCERTRWIWIRKPQIKWLENRKIWKSW